MAIRRDSLFEGTTRPDPENETRAFPQMKPGEVEDPGVCFKEGLRVGRVVPLVPYNVGQKEVPAGRRNRREFPRLSDLDRAVDVAQHRLLTAAYDERHEVLPYPFGTEYVASNPEVETPLVNDGDSQSGTLDKFVSDAQKIHMLRMALYQAIVWNEDYKHINNLSGDPYWVSLAHDALNESR